jgi:hypothetical protein
MAATRSTSGILTADVITRVNFPQYFSNITIVNRDTEGTIWFRTDGIDPAVLGDDNYPVMPGAYVTVPNGILTQEPITRVISGTSVFLISTAPVNYTVFCT